jgi:hypothetical protein
MHGTQTSDKSIRHLREPKRNRYFYGKMMDSYHFELETNYHNSKRWLTNRLVSGYGVVCGLDVQQCSDPYTIRITPGLAIDKCGREILVTQPTEARIPDDLIGTSPTPATPAVEQGAKQGGKKPESSEDKKCIQVMLCYHECTSDPVPVLAGDCYDPGPCAPGSIRERFRIEFTDNCDSPQHDECTISHMVSGGRIDYPALAKWVTRDKECMEVPKDCCIRLAHIYIDGEGGHCGDQDNIDITVRPIVYTNDLLFQILLGWQGESREQYSK